MHCQGQDRRMCIDLDVRINDLNFRLKNNRQKIGIFHVRRLVVYRRLTSGVSSDVSRLHLTYALRQGEQENADCSRTDLTGFILRLNWSNPSDSEPPMHKYSKPRLARISAMEK